MLFFGEAQVYNNPASTHSSLPSQVHFFLGDNLTLTYLSAIQQMQCFQISLLPFRITTLSHNLHMSSRKSHNEAGFCRKAVCLPAWIFPTDSHYSEMHSLGACCPFIAPMQYFLGRASSFKSGIGVKDFILFSFSTIPFASRNIPVVAARLLSRGKDSGGFVPFVFARRLHSC